MTALKAVVGLIAASAVAGAVGACGTDDAEVGRLTTQVEQLTVERDALKATVPDAADRHEKTLAVADELRAILEDPGAVGTHEEVVSAIADLATAEAELEDDALGSVPMRSGWARMLYAGSMAAEVTVKHHWVSPDGSQSGSLWVWHGTNLAGKPFELVAASIVEHDTEGRITHELVVYPYPDEYVVEAVEGAGTPLRITAEGDGR